MGLKTNYSLELTPKEKEIELAICKRGYTKTKQLSQLFFVSTSTINTHLNNIFLKRNVHSIAELIYNFYQKQPSQNAF